MMKDHVSSADIGRGEYSTDSDYIALMCRGCVCMSDGLIDKQRNADAH